MESDIFCIGPSEILEPSCHIDTYISPVPWLDFVSVDGFSLLVALRPAVEVGVGLYPCDILAIASIPEEVTLISRIEYIDRESELVFTISWRSTE